MTCKKKKKKSLIALQKIFCAGNDEHSLLGCLPLAFFVCVCVLNEQTNRQVKIVTCIKRLSATILQQVSVHSCALRVESRVSSLSTRLNTRRPPAALNNRDEEVTII